MTDTRLSLEELENRDDFIPRHIGPDDRQINEMLSTVGADSLEDLIDRIVPESIRSSSPLDLPPVRSEREALSYLRKMAGRNNVLTSMIGMGYYGTITPKVILRNVLENPGWYTAYTPYQAEVSQGRLEVLLTFQQMVMDLTGLDLANASLLDEATAAGEAMTMAKRASKHKSTSFFVDSDTHPQTIGVVETRAKALGYDVIIGDPLNDLDGKDVFGALLSYPGSGGGVRDLRPAIEILHANKALAICATDLLALALLASPGELGFDVAIGSAQRFGVPMGYGGPHAAFFATRDKYKRAVPGRIIGVSVDRQGHPAYRMALQTREQHIRRESATSNICTAQALLAIVATLFAVYHGPKGIETIARRVHRLTGILAEGLKRVGHDVETSAFFDTITVRVPGQAARILARAREQGINLRLVDADHIGISLDQTTRRGEVAKLWYCFETNADQIVSVETLDKEVSDAIPEPLTRSSGYLAHPVFHQHHSETEMLRFLRRLQAKDIALDRSMIPLGSCTMKLNATTEMIPITWREFSHMHPFVPLDQAQGYQQLFEELESMLCEITGFDAVSLQPNAGSQGEYSGLLAIRQYHAANGGEARNICLIPSSAHGTNPASAILAGMKVVVVKCDSDGNVDLEDLKSKAAEHEQTLAALMITYPSTHGVFEEAIGEICQIVHDHGGQVYFDGANLNALLGIAKPAEIGADRLSYESAQDLLYSAWRRRSGAVGPIGVRAHLAPFLPDHGVVHGVNPAAGNRETIGPVAAAPWGSASILPISWAYIAMMGGTGLRRSTDVAILNANYLAKRSVRTTRLSIRVRMAASRTSALSTSGNSRNPVAFRSKTSPNAWSTTAITHQPCPGRWPRR